MSISWPDNVLFGYFEVYHGALVQVNLTVYITQ